jgi:flagellar hook protein FlgE
MSFQQGLSGLNGAAKSLDVIGNNIANSNTVGFKGSQAQFADVYAASLNGAGAANAGIGAKVAAIAQQFTQGNIEASNNPMDIAINGAGFFRTVMGGTVQYTRNGQFSLDKDGSIVSSQGAQLTGYSVGGQGQILAGNVGPIKINTADLKPVATTRVDTQMQLDSGESVPVNKPFNATDPTTYNKQVPVEVFDTLGNSHVMSMFYVKTGSGTWDVYVGSDGVEMAAQKVAATGQTDPTVAGARTAWQTASQAVPQDPVALASALQAYAIAAGQAVATAAGTAGASPATQTAITTAAGSAGGVVGGTPDDVDRAIAKAVQVTPVPVGRLAFDTNGSLSSTLMPQTLPLTVNLPIFPPTGANLTLPVTLNFTGTTQYGTTTSEKKTTQDGYTAGHLQRFTTGADGIILGQYSNGRSQPLGQIVLANFENPNGLQPLGNNAWAETSTSGSPIVGTPNTGSLGVLQSSAVENSNVDLTAELVNMITAQRVYQANAQTIKTQDSVLQTLVNLR